ncbi:hypothetical protein [Halovenus marina]
MKSDHAGLPAGMTVALHLTIGTAVQAARSGDGWPAPPGQIFRSESNQ